MFFLLQKFNSRGVAILLNNNFDYKLHQDNGGNLIIMHF